MTTYREELSTIFCRNPGLRSHQSGDQPSPYPHGLTGIQFVLDRYPCLYDFDTRAALLDYQCPAPRSCTYLHSPAARHGSHFHLVLGLRMSHRKKIAASSFQNRPFCLAAARCLPSLHWLGCSMPIGNLTLPMLALHDPYPRIVSPRPILPDIASFVPSAIGT